MPRKRKVPVVDEEKENEVGQSQSQSQSQSQNLTIQHGPMYTIMSNVQLNETFHKKYIREMQQLYGKMDHDAFMFTFIKMVKSAMEGDEANEFAYTTLLFCAKFIAAYDIDDTHPVLVDTCRWLLTTISQNPHIRFRLCQFVNMILNALGVEAALDDAICDSILEYMLRRLRDINPNVRVQAILALQRLQCPDNPDDIVLRVYQFHLCSDPSPRVRQAVITSMGRNYNTIPYILDRLWDIDEKVRRHTYLHMSGYPVKAYKVSQRLQLLEQGLNDRSEMVKKVVTTIMLPQWLESYNKNYITFVSALKLDASEAEVERFLKIAKVALHEIFKRQKREDLVKCVPLEEDGEFHKCVPHETLTVEVTLYWQCLIEHLQAEMADELDMIIPELSTFCAYVLRFCESQKVATDKFVRMEFQYVLLSLCEILYLYDLGDEIGRDNLKKLICTILKSNDLEEKIIEVIVKCTENLITDQNSRLQFFVEIIEEITHTSSFKNDLLINDRNLIEELLEKHPDKDLKLKLSSLKVKILDLEEQEMNYVEMKDYVQAHRITEEKNAYTEEYTNLLKPLLDKHSLSTDSSSDQSKSLSSFQKTNKITPETIQKSLQLSYYMVVSKNVKSLTPNVCKLYKEFIGRHIASNQIVIRDWALKCGTAYSMLYEPLAKEIYEVLYAQFFKNHNIRIWKTSITCIFELLDRYGCSSFNIEEREERQNKTKRNGRQLYNTLEFLDADDDSSVWSSGQAVDIIFMMSHFLDTCDDVCIISAIINGFCRLVLHDHIKNAEILEKLLLRYFNPSTDAEINQILGVFLENLIQRKKQDYLHPCLLPTVSQVISAPYESPLHEIKPETILRFVIDATRPEFCAPGANIHNKLALSFLQEMQNNIANKDLCKILSKELLTLEMSVQDDLALKGELKGIAEKLIKCEFDSKLLKNIINFKDMLDGIFNPPLRHANLDGSDDEDKSDDETVSAITTEREFDKVSSNDTASNRLERVVEEDKESEQEKDSEKEAEPDKELTNGNEKEVETETEKEKETEVEKETENEQESEKEKEPESAKEAEKEEQSKKKKVSGKEKESENTKEADKEKEPDPSAEPPPTPVAVVEPSPSTPVHTPRQQTTPTTYGRENSTGLRYLRKSMNFSRQKSAADEGPSPKIRIEARIDSIPSPPKVQKMNDNVRPTRRNLRAVTKPSAAVEVNNEQPATNQRQSARKAAAGRRPASTSKGRAQQASKEKETSTAEDSDESEVIPPSPTSTAASDATVTRTLKKRVNRTLRYNNTQAQKTPATQTTKATRLNRNNSSANALHESVELNRSPEPSTRNTRKRPLSPSVISSSNEGDNDCASPLRKQSKTSVNLSEITRNTTSHKQSTARTSFTTNTSKQQQLTTPITNRLRAKNSNVPEKSVQRPKSTRSALNKTNSPSSKENEPKSPSKSATSSSSSTQGDESSSSSDEDEEPSMNTPKNKTQSKHSVTKSIEKRIRSSRNPVLTLHRQANTSSSANRVSTRNSARKDRQNNMIMTRKRLSLESSRSASKTMATTTHQKKSTTTITVVPSKASKIPVNLALRSNMNSDKTKPKPTTTTTTATTTTSSIESSTNSSGSSSDELSSAANSGKLSTQSKPSLPTRNALLVAHKAKPTLATGTRIARMTRKTDAKTMLRKRNI